MSEQVLEFKTVSFTILEVNGDWVTCQYELLDDTGVALWFSTESLRVGDSVTLLGIEDAKVRFTVSDG